MLVVIGITTILSAVAIGYSKIGQNEVALTVETSKVAELILQAKELAINTYGSTASGEKACAFGVHFDFTNPATPTYSLFAYAVVNPDIRCPSAASTTVLLDSAKKDSPYSWDISPAQGVTLDDPKGHNVLTDVLFYPPNPATLISQDDPGNYYATFMLSPSTSYIYLSTTDGRNSSTIAVSPDGQVTF
jgi:hypothetical protein